MSDDEGRPLRTDLGDLVDRAGADAAGPGRPGIAAVLLAGGLAATVVVAVAALQSGHGDGAGPAPTTSPPTSTASHAGEAPTLTAAQVVARCRPQLAAYSSLPMYTQHPDRADWSLQPGRYLVGDLVLVDPNDGYNPEFCRVPASGHERDRVPLASYTGSANNLDDLTQNCRQLGGSSFSGTGFSLRDAASGAITAADTVDGVSAAVLVTRGRRAGAVLGRARDLGRGHLRGATLRPRHRAGRRHHRRGQQVDRRPDRVLVPARQARCLPRR